MPTVLLHCGALSGVADESRASHSNTRESSCAGPRMRLPYSTCGYGRGRRSGHRRTLNERAEARRRCEFDAGHACLHEVEAGEVEPPVCEEAALGDELTSNLAERARALVRGVDIQRNSLVALISHRMDHACLVNYIITAQRAHGTI